MENPFIFSTKESAYFAALIAQALGIDTGFVERWSFGDGEQYYRIGVEERMDLLGRDVIFVASTHTDSDFLELYRVGCALAGYGTQRRIFVIPFFGYSTMERAVKAGEVVTAKTNARILSSIPNSGMGNVFLMLDLHVAGLVHYFEGDCLRYELYAEEVLGQGISSLGLNDFVMASADLGRPLWVKAFAKKFGTTMALIDKDREGEETKVFSVVGDVRGKDVVVYDDMIRGGGTLIHAIEAYYNHGARSVDVVLSHFALNSESVVKILEDSPIRRIITTNSHPMSQCEEVKRMEKMGGCVVLDVSSVFVEAIKRILEI